MAGMWKRVAVLGVVFIAIVSVLATQYGRIETQITFRVAQNAPYIGYMVRELDPNSTNAYLLTKGANNQQYILNFGAFMPGTAKTYTAAFAIFSEERYDVELWGAELRETETYGGGTTPYTQPSGVHIYVFVHGDWGETCAGRLPGNPVGAGAADMADTAGTDCLMLIEDGTSLHQTAPTAPWWSGQDPGSDGTYNDPWIFYGDVSGGADSDWSDYMIGGTSYSMAWETRGQVGEITADRLYKSDPSEPANAGGTRTSGTDSAVWVEITIIIDSTATNMNTWEDCYIWFSFRSLTSP